MSDQQKRPVRFRYELRDQQPEMVLLGAPRPCQACSEPCLTATPRQRTKGTHISCFHDGWKWGLTDLVERRAVAAIIDAFREYQPSPGPEQVRKQADSPRTWTSDIPCICGTTDNVVVWRGCKEWQEPYALYRCFAHPPYRIPPQSWEVRA